MLIFESKDFCPYNIERMGEERVLSDVQKLKESLPGLPEPVARPFFIIMSGLPGTGKSYFSRKLVERLPCAILESDMLRKILFPSPSYSAQESQRLFSAIHLLISELLNKGIPVLLDATNLAEGRRELLYHIADRARAKLIIVRVEAPVEIVRKRLQARFENPSPEDMSDADFKVYQRMRRRAQKIRRNHFVVDTSRDITPVIEKIIREVRR